MVSFWILWVGCVAGGGNWLLVYDVVEFVQF